MNVALRIFEKLRLTFSDGWFSRNFQSVENATKIETNTLFDGQYPSFLVRHKNILLHAYRDTVVFFLSIFFYSFSGNSVRYKVFFSFSIKRTEVSRDLHSDPTAYTKLQFRVVRLDDELDDFIHLLRFKCFFIYYLTRGYTEHNTPNR